MNNNSIVLQKEVNIITDRIQNTGNCLFKTSHVCTNHIV